MASIIIATGEQAGVYLPLGKAAVVIGRAENLPMQINDEKVSRKHIQIKLCDDGVYRVKDMESSNGTLVCGRKITAETALRDGDEIQIGATSLLFTTEDPEGQPNALELVKKAGQRGRSTLMR